MSSHPSDVQMRLADIFREKERYLEEKRRRAEAADQARRSHAKTFHDVVVTVALPVFETIGAGLAAYGLEHRIKRVGLLDNDPYEAEQQVTFEFRMADDAGSGGPVLGRAFLRLSTDVESKVFRLHTEIAGGPDTPFAGSSSDTCEVRLADLDAAFFQAAALDLVDRAVRSTYLEPDESPDRRSEPRRDEVRDDPARTDAARDRESRGRASQDGASRDGDSRDGASASASTSASMIGT